MPTKLKDIIYGEDKNTDFKKFNLGNVTQAIADDLQEFGQSAVQGMVVKETDATTLVTYCKAAGLTKPYLMVGVCNNDLVLVVRDKGNPRYEQMAVLVKNYVAEKKKLAENTAAVVNANKGDPIIDDAAVKPVNKFATGVQDEGQADFGGVTGDILLCAHGTPKVNVGRVIGTKLGKMTPVEVADLLTKNPDKRKRLAEGYNGKITLSGCFTASGGPEALAQDDPFAKKVWDELKRRGFTRCSVVGIPGVSMTAREGQPDDDDVVMKQGDEAAWVRSEEMLQALDQKAAVIRADIDKLTDGLVKEAAKLPGDKAPLLGSEGARKIIAVIKDKEAALQKLKAEMESIQADQKKYGDVDGKLMAHVTGSFGLRVINRAFAK